MENHHRPKSRKKHQKSIKNTPHDVSRCKYEVVKTASLLANPILTPHTKLSCIIIPTTRSSLSISPTPQHFLTVRDLST